LTGICRHWQPVFTTYSIPSTIRRSSYLRGRRRHDGPNGEVSTTAQALPTARRSNRSIHAFKLRKTNPKHSPYKVPPLVFKQVLRLRETFFPNQVNALLLGGQLLRGDRACCAVLVRILHRAQSARAWVWLPAAAYRSARSSLATLAETVSDGLAISWLNRSMACGSRPLP